MSNKSEFLISGIETGKLNALVKTIMKKMDLEDPAEAIRQVCSSNWILRKSNYDGYEEDGIIYLSVTSKGWTGKMWINYLGEMDMYIDDRSRHYLLSDRFKPTTNKKIEVAIIKGDSLETKDLLVSRIRTIAESKNFSEPSLETLLLVREKFSRKDFKEMDLEYYIVAMHKAIIESSKKFLMHISLEKAEKIISVDMGDPSDRFNGVGGHLFEKTK